MVVRKMKEKCKDAARMRREKERAEFVELSKLLPLPSSTTSQLDKASIIRLTSSYLRMRAAFPQGLGENWGTSKLIGATSDPGRSIHQPAPADRQQTLFGGKQLAQIAPQPQQQQQQIRELGSLILQTLNGFVFALHKDGKIMYVSETASVHLGLPQIDLTGSSIFEYIHPSDYNDINELFTLKDSDKAELESKTNNSGTHYELCRSFCMRMKCILPKRNAGLVSNGYKAIHCSGYLKVRCNPSNIIVPKCGQKSDSNNINRPDKEWEAYALVAVGHSLLPTASTEVKLGASSFMFRASLDLKFYYIEAPVMKLLGYEQVDMIGQSLYQFVHVEDSNNLAEAHKLLLNKGQVVTKYYRLMRRDGGCVWVEMHATLVNNPRSMPKPQHIVSICFVLGQNEIDQSRSLNQQQQQQIFHIGSTGSNDKTKAFFSLENNQPHGIRTISNQSNNKREHEQKGKLPTANKKTRKFSPKSTQNNQLSNQVVTENNRTSNSTEFNRLHHCHGSFTPSASTTIILHNNNGHYNSIGSLRRPSDDSCSIISSITSTSVSSNGSSSYQTPEFLVTNQTYTNTTSDVYPTDTIGHENIVFYQNKLHQSPQRTDSMEPMATNPSATMCNVSQQVWLMPTNRVGGDIESPLNDSGANNPFGQVSCNFNSQDPASKYHFHQSNWIPMQQFRNNCQQPSNSDIYYHRLDEQPIEGGYQQDTSYMTHYNESALYFEVKNGPPVHHYQHSACLSNGYTA